ncbi:MAG: extracellular solute-binding protein [Candidatus Omnitrophica bacterium]|nr:extracellular solute-binding protein [Candidatus Omnitrophota bacterium]
MRIPRFNIYLILLFSLLLLLSLPSPASAEKITLTLWEFSGYEELMQELLKKFEAEHPHIRIKVQQLSWEHGLEKIIVSIAAGNAPDVVELGTDWVPKFASAGVLRDLTEETKDLQEAYFLWEAATYDKKRFGVPWLAGTRILFYNRDLFKRAGLDSEKVPKTWEELLEAAKSIRRLGENIYGFAIFVGEPYSPWQEFLPFAWGNGAKILSDDQKRCLIDSPEMVEALSYYQKLKPYSLIDRQSQVNNLFADNKVGMQISGAWNFRLIPRLNPQLNFGVALLPKPAPDRGFPASFAGGEIFSILKSSPHPEEAMALIRFMTEEENAIEVVKLQQNVVPTFKKSMDHSYFKTHPDQRLFFEQMATAVAPPNHPLWVDMQEHLTRAIEEVIVQNTPPQKALRRAKERIERILVEEKAPFALKERVVALSLGGGLFLIGMLLFMRKKSAVFSGKTFLRENRTTWIFLSPWLLTFLLFGLYPLFHSLLISLSRYNLLNAEVTFVGFQNYAALLKDRDFHHAFWHTLFFAAGTIPFTLLLALITAILIHRKIPFKGLYQAGLFLPVSTSVIVIATLFLYLYSPEGLFNALLDQFGLPKPDPTWLVNIHFALPSIMVMNIWASFGYYMILILAGLQAIPESLYEAAEIDGANEWQRFWHITLPQLRPILLFVGVIQTIYSFQVFPEVLTMTQGGPLGATTTVVYHLYETGFQKFEMGLASAVGYFLFLVIMIFSLAQMRLFKLGEQTGE